MKVKFLPSQIELEISPNESVMHLAHHNNIHIQSVCKGIPSCAECRIRVIEGDYNVVPPSSTEISLIGSSYFVDGRRLSCQLRCFGDITVDLTEQIEKEERAIKKPRGKVVRSSEESRAKLGSMILEDSGGDVQSDLQTASVPISVGDDFDDEMTSGAEIEDLDIELPEDLKPNKLARLLRDDSE